MVQCAKFGKLMEGLPKPPLKGEVGQRVFDEVSKEAWRMWLEHSKMLVNEFRERAGPAHVVRRAREVLLGRRLTAAARLRAAKDEVT
jgi:Fe-S cluster biosynthesis and repair protein YggX